MAKVLNLAKNLRCERGGWKIHMYVNNCALTLMSILSQKVDNAAEKE